MSAKTKCSNSPDVFCYVCGEFILAKDRRKITEKAEKSYLRYFGVKTMDKPWTPHVICKACQVKFIRWEGGAPSPFKFGVPMIWREPENCINDCYFCMVKTVGFHAKNKHLIKYPNIPSAIRPVAHSSEVPTPSTSFTSEDMDQHMESDVQLPSTETIQETSPSSSTFNQAELNDLVHDLELSKVNSELLASTLKEKNDLAPGTNTTFFRTREQELLVYFGEKKPGNGNFVYCQDIQGLLKRMGVEEYLLGEWRLFVDTNKRSLKFVLLYNGSEYSPVSIGHSIHVKEKYKEIKMVLNLLKYQEQNWIICVDLKMVNFLLEQQSGYTKYLCFFCLWDSRAKERHWVQREWPEREMLTVGKHVIHEQLVDKEKIVFPLLHIRLGLMKQFVKALDKDGAFFFQYITDAFPGLSEEKKDGNF